MKLFDSLITPILLYSSEIWGYENNDIIEKIHLGFLKRILGVRVSTPNYMVYGETGRYPLEINIKLRMLNFWVRLLTNQTKLSSMLYQLLYNMQINEVCNFKWLNYVQSIFDDVGLSYVWNNQFVLSSTDIKVLVRQILCDQFIQKWHVDMGNSSRGIFYASHKRNLDLKYTYWNKKY